MHPHIKAVALKHRIGLDGDMDNHITGRAAVGAGVALAAQRDVLIIVNAAGMRTSSVLRLLVLPVRGRCGRGS